MNFTVSPTFKPVSLSSLDKEFKSQQQMNAQVKLLEKSNNEFERTYIKQVKANQHQRDSVIKELKESVLQKTPNTEEWMRLHRDQYDSWKERERDKIRKRFPVRTRLSLQTPNVVNISPDLPGGDKVPKQKGVLASGRPLTSYRSKNRGSTAKNRRFQSSARPGTDHGISYNSSSKITSSYV